jgi:ABC-type transport system involved in Fe-S cluster assembly fused permease/ATPase subunit
MDPLAQLSDIHLPANVHSYPIAPGWWLLTVIVLALIIYGVLKLRQNIIKRKAQKMALKQLSTATEISAMVTLLKWAALQYFPREQVAHLTGDAFKAFLIATLPTKQQHKFAELSAEHFTSVYQSDPVSKTSAEFSAAAKLWLNRALPPQKNLSMLATPITRNSVHNSKEVENDGVKS